MKPVVNVQYICVVSMTTDLDLGSRLFIMYLRNGSKSFCGVDMSQEQPLWVWDSLLRVLGVDVVASECIYDFACGRGFVGIASWLGILAGNAPDLINGFHPHGRREDLGLAREELKVARDVVWRERLEALRAVTALNDEGFSLGNFDESIACTFYLGGGD